MADEAPSTAMVAASSTAVSAALLGVVFGTLRAV
jgi:hypothetical protein